MAGELRDEVTQDGEAVEREDSEEEEDEDSDWESESVIECNG